MTAVAELINALIASGMTAADAAALVARAGAEMSTPQRSKGAVRTQRWRDRKSSQSVTGDAPVTQNDPPPTTVTERHKPSQSVTCDAAQKTPLILSSSPPSQEIQKEGKKERGDRKAGRSLPADWQPTVGHYDEGAKLGLRLFEIETMADDMRLWAGANSNRAVARKSNWDMTFSAWMRREAGKRKPTNGKSGILDAADRAIENLRQREAADSGPGVGGQAAFRLISQG